MSDVKTRFHLADGALTVERSQDVEAIIERNKQLQSLEQKSDWGRHVACIPNVIIERWLNEEWARGNTQLRLLSDELDRLVQKKLNDPEWRFLRTD